MPFTTPLQFALIALLLVGGWLIGFASNGGGRKWRKRFEQERAYYATYRDETDAIHRANKQRIAALEAELAVRAPQPQVIEPVADVVVEPEATAIEPAPVEVEAAPAMALTEELPAEPETAHAEPPAEHETQSLAEPEPVAPAEHPIEHPAEPEPTPAMALPLPDDHEEPTWADEAEAQPATAAIPVAADAHEPEITVIDADTHEAEAAPVEHHEATVEPHEEAAPLIAADHAAKAESVSVQHPLARLRGVDDATAARLAEVGIASFDDIEQLSAEDEMALEERIGVPAGFIAREQLRSQAALLRAGNESEFAERFGAALPA